MVDKKLIIQFREEVKAFKERYQDNLSKQNVKELYEPVLKKKYKAITERYPNWIEILREIVVDPIELDPTKITPKLKILKRGKSNKYTDYFNVVQLFWTIPLSAGFGRRIRALVFDEYHNKLMGILALGDPVYSRKTRDEHIGWNKEIKKKKLVNIMSTYILGAIPPYNHLKIGKYIAKVAGSREIIDEFYTRYHHKKGIISGKKKKAQLIAIINSTAFGKSSMMDRIRKPNWELVGFSHGTGTSFQSDGIYDLAKKLVMQEDKETYDSYKFGDGANWKLRILRKAYSIANISPSALDLGNQKGIYFAPLAKNWKEILNSKKFIEAEYPEEINYKDYWNNYNIKVRERANRIEYWKVFKLEERIKKINSYLL